MLLLIGSCPCPWVPDSYFQNLCFFRCFFRLIDTTVTVCKGTSVNQPVTALIGENVWRSLGRAWKLTWFLDGQVITMCMIEARNIKNLFTLGKLVQRTKT